MQAHLFFGESWKIDLHSIHKFCQFVENVFVVLVPSVQQHMDRGLAKTSQQRAFNRKGHYYF